MAFGAVLNSSGMAGGIAGSLVSCLAWSISASSTQMLLSMSASGHGSSTTRSKLLTKHPRIATTLCAYNCGLATTCSTEMTRRTCCNDQYDYDGNDVVHAHAPVNPLRNPRIVLVRDTPPTAYLVHQDVPASATQAAEVVDVKHRLRVVPVKTDTGNSDVSDCA